MFDFEKLVVYTKTKAYAKEARKLIQSHKNWDTTTKDQLRRASFSIMLNIAEGAGRFSDKDKRHFYVVARSSTFECVAIYEFLMEEDLLEEKTLPICSEIVLLSLENSSAIAFCVNHTVSSNNNT